MRICRENVAPTFLVRLLPLSSYSHSLPTPSQRGGSEVGATPKWREARTKNRRHVMNRMNISTLPISSEHAAAMLDTRGMIHTNGLAPTLTLHIPQRDVAEALTEYWGEGTLDTYR